MAKPTHPALGASPRETGAVFDRTAANLRHGRQDVRSSCGCCDMRPRTYDDVPTGNVGPGLPRAIPRNLGLDETIAVVGLYAFSR